jgi:hypothetical protein
VAVLKDLLPCPCCGDQAKLKWADYNAYCGNCGLQGASLRSVFNRPYDYSEKARREGITMLWNCRSQTEYAVVFYQLKSDPDIMARRLRDPGAKMQPTLGTKGKKGSKSKTVWAICAQNVATFVEDVEYKVQGSLKDPEAEVVAVDDDGVQHTVKAKYFKAT